MRSAIKLTLALFVLLSVNTELSAQKKSKKKKKCKKECCSTSETVQKIELKNNMDSVSFAIGSTQAKGLLEQVPDLNVKLFLEGFSSFVDTTESIISEEEGQALLQAFGQKMQERQQAKQQQEGAGVKQAGLDFLAANRSKPGVKVTASGLQYIVMKEGKGEHPTATSNVEVHYHGTTPDGTVFDSSVDRGESISFGLNQVIKGWTEGVQLMKEGAKYKFFIPQELAYGANPRPGGAIKPYMPLVFEVELIKINK